MSGSHRGRRPHTALVVDDDVVWRRIIAHTLTKHGATVEMTSTLQEALDALNSAPVDLLFLDYELPDGRGLDVLDRIDRSRFGRVVLVTGYADVLDLDDSRSASVDGYLTKPFLSSELVAWLDLPMQVPADVATHAN